MNIAFWEGLDGYLVASLPFSRFAPSPFNYLSLHLNSTFIFGV